MQARRMLPRVFPLFLFIWFSLVFCFFFVFFFEPSPENSTSSALDCVLFILKKFFFLFGAVSSTQSDEWAVPCFAWRERAPDARWSLLRAPFRRAKRKKILFDFLSVVFVIAINTCAKNFAINWMLLACFQRVERPVNLEDLFYIKTLEKMENFNFQFNWISFNFYSK